MHTNKFNTMFVHFHNVLKYENNVVVSSSYIISDIQIRNNKVGREVNLIPGQDKKSVGKMLTSIGVPSNTSLGKYMRERVAQAITTECGGCIHVEPRFYAGIENVGGTTRVWIFNADYDNIKTKKLYGTINMIEGKVVDGRSVTTLHRETLTTHRANSKYTSEGRSFRPYVTKQQDHTTMTHHLELDSCETRGRPLKVKAKLTASSTAKDVKAAVIENIEVTNHNADVVSEVAETVSELRDEVAELKAQIALMMLAQRGTEVPHIPALAH
ncbi:hypothetical protein [Aeromonas salmonicida]|uniref:hypothetical protein n=1 Tax=Aeromonas salmonicida TaxID=645 RepID=UPI000F7AFE62|nr:hypothetical protein [Aeromonas salmonicida]RSM24971.1 hypothetical protein C5B77_19440 [Aeromonas salmonicida]